MQKKTEESPDFTSGASKNPRLTAGANKKYEVCLKKLTMKA